MSPRIDLGLLEVRGLVRPVQTQPELEYNFKHTLVQESAYRSLLREERVRLHRATGEVLERVYPEARDELAPRLGHHFGRAGEHDRAHEYLMLAGNQALRVHAYAEAVRFFQSALESAEAVHQDRRGRISESYQRLGRAFELAGKHAAALDCYEQMERRGRQENWDGVELEGRLNQATLFSTPSPLMDRERGVELSERTLEMAQRMGEVRAEVRSRRNLALALALTVGREAEAIQHGEKALELAEPVQEEEFLAFLYNDVGRNHMFCGNSVRARELLEAAERRWRELENIPMLVDSLVSSVGLELFCGDFDQIPTRGEEARRLALETGNLWAQAYSHAFLDTYYLNRGDFGRALSAAQQGVELGETGGFSVISMLALYNLADLYVELGEFDLAWENAQRSREAAERMVHNWLAQPRATLAKLSLKSGDIERARAYLADVTPVYEGAASCFHIAYIAPTLALGDLALAEGRAEEALEIARRTRAGLERRRIRLPIPSARLIEARALIAQGDLDQASATLDHGINLAQDMGARRILWRLAALRAEVDERRGDRQSAERMRGRAAAVVENIAASLEGSGHQGSFLARPDVRELRETA